MMEFFDQLTGLELFYLMMITAGGTVFLMRLILMFFVGTDGDPSAADASLADSSDAMLRYVSIQSLSSFALVGGLAGFWAERTFHNSMVSVLLALFAGALMVFIMVRITMLLMKLQTKGNLEITDAVGKEGTVYLTIPEEGMGQIDFNMQGRKLFRKAASETGQRIATGTKVRIVRVTDDSVLMVEPVISAGSRDKNPGKQS